MFYCSWWLLVGTCLLRRSTTCLIWLLFYIRDGSFISTCVNTLVAPLSLQWCWPPIPFINTFYYVNSNWNFLLIPSFSPLYPNPTYFLNSVFDSRTFHESLVPPIPFLLLTLLNTSLSTDSSLGLRIPRSLVVETPRWPISSNPTSFRIKKRMPEPDSGYRFWILSLWLVNFSFLFTISWSFVS